MRGTSSWLCVLGMGLFGCGGAADTELLGGDAGSNTDGSSGGDVITTTDTGNQGCDVAKCASIPSGFHAARLADGQSSCPKNWDTSKAVTNPVAADGTCTCSCNVTQDPSCGTGQIFRYLDDSSTATCGQQATTFTGNSGGCSFINNALYLNHAHYEVNAPPPTGGSCQYDAKLDSSKVSSTSTLVCAPPASCQGAICDGGPVCVAQDGDVDCPSTFPTKTLVGQSASATCGACSATCLATGTCTGTLSFYTDTQCQTGKVDFTADGTCNANVASTTTPYYSYSYAGKLQTSTCAGQAPTSTPTATLDGPTTVCCK